MQKELRVIKVLFFVFLMCIFNAFGQKNIIGEYSFVDGTGYFFENYSFDESGLFDHEKGGDLGISSFGKGHYQIKNDSLILSYDLTELKTNDYHKLKYYLNNKDSIKVAINIYDLDKRPVYGTAVSIFSEKVLKRSNKDGVVEFYLKKEKKQQKFNVSNIGFGYNFSIWKNRNSEIDVYLNLKNFGTAIKNQVIKYQIIEHSKEYIKLKSKKQLLKLVKQTQ